MNLRIVVVLNYHISLELQENELEHKDEHLEKHNTMSKGNRRNDRIVNELSSSELMQSIKKIEIIKMEKSEGLVNYLH